MIEILLGSAVFVAIVLSLTLAVTAARRVLLPSASVSVSVNSRNRFDAKVGDRLLAALAGEGIAIPAACGGAGTCGLCRVTVTSGGGDVLPTEKSRISRSDLARGTRLACQVALRGDITVSVPDSLLSAKEWDCTIVSSRTVSPLIREIIMELPAGERIDFRPGAFVQVTAPAHRIAYADFVVSEEHKFAWEKLAIQGLTSESRTAVARAYSIANRPEDGNGKIVLLIRLALPPPHITDAPPGIVSSWLFGLGSGDSVKVSGPFGEFGARDGAREMVFIGGGVGMAPLRAIIFDQLERARTARKISFWYGARSLTDLFYREEFEELQQRHPNFSWTPALSDAGPGDDWQGATGFIHDVVLESYLKSHPRPEACEYYLCGPPLMIKSILAMLDDLGISPDDIHNDDFGA
jgi:Na+-transporting NADH:ubiquinone oxidoreductase subunit F